MGKDYEKIRAQVHKKYKDEITCLNDTIKDLTETIEKYETSTKALEKENEELKVLVAKYKLATGLSQDDVVKLRLESELESELSQIFKAVVPRFF